MTKTSLLMAGLLAVSLSAISTVQAENRNASDIHEAENAQVVPDATIATVGTPAPKVR